MGLIFNVFAIKGEPKMTMELFGIMMILQALAIFILKSFLENTIKFEFRNREQAAME